MQRTAHRAATRSESRTDRRVTPPARELRLQASDVPVNYGAWRGVRKHAADLMSRLERRAVYLPGV